MILRADLHRRVLVAPDRRVHDVAQVRDVALVLLVRGAGRALRVQFSDHVPRGRTAPLFPGICDRHEYARGCDQRVGLPLLAETLLD